MEQSLIFIKPDGVERGLVGEVLKRFEQRQIKLKQLELKQLSPDQVDAHYIEHVEKPFYPNLKQLVVILQLIYQ